MSQINGNIKLEKFDKLWELGDPAIIEKAFRELLPQANALQDKSIYLQLLSQIALTQALQRHFDAAHKTLNDAEKLLTPEQNLARARILLERGRIFQQEAYFSPYKSEKLAKARFFFERAFKLSVKYSFDYDTINAAHMIAIVAKKPEEKIKWNKQAIKLAQKTKDEKARAWLGSLYNNLGQSFLEAKQFENAFLAFKKALKYRKKEGYIPNIRVAKWAIGQTLRLLGHLDKALTIQGTLPKEYDSIAWTGSFDMPEGMFKLMRGLVYEELAEIYDAKAKVFATLAYNELSKDIIFKATEPKRLKKLKQKSK